MYVCMNNYMHIYRSMERHKEKYAEEMELKALEADPMNPELQKKIEERVRTLHV